MDTFVMRTVSGNTFEMPMHRFASIFGRGVPLLCLEVQTDSKGNKTNVIVENVNTCETVKLPYTAFKTLIRTNVCLCLNYGVTKNGRFIKKTLTARIKAYMRIREYNWNCIKRQNILGLMFNPDLFYVTEDGAILLEKARNIVTGTHKGIGLYQMPPFVTGFKVDVTGQQGPFTEYKGALKVTNNGENHIAYLDFMFARCKDITTLDLTEFSTKGCISMMSMFEWSNIVHIEGLENFDTSAVTTVSYMFRKASALRDCKVGTWDMANVHNIGNMFEGCAAVTELDLNSWNLSNCEIFRQVFLGMHSLKTLHISEWDVSKGVTFTCMFSECYALTAFEVSKWKMCSAKSFGGMFSGCSMTELNLTNWLPSKIVDTSAMFSNCSRLHKVQLNHWQVENLKTAEAMFFECSSLTSVLTIGWKTTRLQNTDRMFAGCTSLETVKVDHFDVSQLSTMWRMFEGCTALQYLNLKSWQPKVLMCTGGAFLGCKNLVTIQKEVSAFFPMTKVDEECPFGSDDNADCFEGCDSLRELMIYKYNIMQKRKADVLGVEYIPNKYVVHYNGEVTLTDFYDINGVYYIPPFVTRCEHSVCCLRNLKPKIKIYKGHKMQSLYALFNGMPTVQELDLTEFKLCGEENIAYMFNCCIDLQKVYFGDFDTSAVTNMQGLFYGCSALREIDLSGWNVQNVQNAKSIFGYCTALQKVDLTGWHLKSKKAVLDLFKRCDSLQEVKGTNIPVVELRDKTE